jgi:hypothetical protein
MSTILIIFTQRSFTFTIVLNAMLVVETLRHTFRNWARNSTGLGIYARQVRTLVRKARDRDRSGNIAMLHAGRCGSSVLADMLNQHSDIRWANEPFENMLPAYYRMSSAKRAYHVISNSMHARPAKYYGFDSKYLPEQHLRPELANKSPEQYIALLDSLGFNYFILLNRRNHLRRAISVQIGSQTGQWNTAHPNEIRRATVRLDPQRFVSYGKEMPLKQYFHSLDTTYAVIKQHLAERRLLELVYEDDIQHDPRLAYMRTCHFLGIDAQPVNVRLQKINLKPIHELVENFEEVETCLNGTEYEWMLRE